MYGIYVYAPSKDLGVQSDDTVSMNVYAMATYTDSDCTVKNTINPMAILSSSCASSSCCETTTVIESNTSISYMILESVPLCPSVDVINGDIEESNANETSLFTWQFFVFLVAGYMILFHINERKRIFDNSGYTNVDNNDESVEVELPSIQGSDKMFRTIHISDYQQVG